MPWSALLDRLQAVDVQNVDAELYQELCTIVTEHPLTEQLRAQDPFSEAYRHTAMKLYLDIRGSAASGYDPSRDERSNAEMPENLWSGVSPWSFHNSTFVSEFLYSWAQIMRLLDVKPGDSVLEYGPGSGQLLLILARCGIDAYGVDIDQPSIDVVRAQAAALGLSVKMDRAVFGEGFGDQTFDRIVFFEAFHHAFDIQPLIARLDQRLRPGGAIVLCGEPIVGHEVPYVPFPWGPRLDGLSILCMRRYGWMELGLTDKFLRESFHRAGWVVEWHPFPISGRANAYVLRRAADARPTQPAPPEQPVAPPPPLSPEIAGLIAERDGALATIESLRASTSWRITAPIRALRTAFHFKSRTTPP